MTTLAFPINPSVKKLADTLENTTRYTHFNEVSPAAVICIAEHDVIAQLQNAKAETCFRSNSIEEALTSIKKQPFHVGLFQLSQQNYTRQEQDFCRLFQADKKIEWIALVTPESAEEPIFRRLIAEYFYDYHTLPIDLNRLMMSIGHAHGMASIRQSSVIYTDDTLNSHQIIGKSSAIKAVLYDISKVIQTDSPVLIQGESGTGKELAALAIHNNSSRANKPFVAVNCGALPANLIQSELFGHEKGAFTGANQRKIGYIEHAAGGTIFLDEIGDLSLDLQVNLLRFLQTKTIHRIGGHKIIPIDVRVISATHVDLLKAVENRSFREDLFYRLNVLQINIPALRDRGQDIEVLAKHFLEQFKANGFHTARGFSQDALGAMNYYTWPGNVRELRNAVHRAVVMCDERLITAADLGISEILPKIIPMSLKTAKEKAEFDIISKTLSLMGNSMTRTSKVLGISRVTLYRLLKKHRIEAIDD